MKKCQLKLIDKPYSYHKWLSNRTGIHLWGREVSVGRCHLPVFLIDSDGVAPGPGGWRGASRGTGSFNACPLFHRAHLWAEASKSLAKIAMVGRSGPPGATPDMSVRVTARIGLPDSPGLETGGR